MVSSAPRGAVQELNIPTEVALPVEREQPETPVVPSPSSMVVFDAFVRPMLWRLGGEIDRDPWPTQRRARLARAVLSQVGREDYVRVRLFTRDGELWADPLPGGSSAISNLVLADGLVKIEAARDRIAEGDPVEVAGF